MHFDVGLNTDFTAHQHYWPCVESQTAKAVNCTAQVNAVTLGDVRHVTVDRRTATAELTLAAHPKSYNHG